MTDVTLDTRLQRNPDLMAADMDGELVMMSVEKGTYYGLGGTSSTVWSLIERRTSVREIVAAICRDFEVDPPTCETDVLAFARDLVRNGIASAC